MHPLGRAARPLATRALPKTHHRRLFIAAPFPRLIPSHHMAAVSTTQVRAVFTRACLDPASEEASIDVAAASPTVVKEGVVPPPSRVSAWVQLVDLVFLSTASRGNDDDSNGDGNTQPVSFDSVSLPLRELWKAHYAPALSTLPRSTLVIGQLDASVVHGVAEEVLPLTKRGTSQPSAGPNTSSADSATMAENAVAQELFPAEAEQLPLYVQALAQLASALKSRIEEGSNAAVTDAPSPELLSAKDLYEWLAEVQAVLLFIALNQLRFLIPTTFHSAYKRDGTKPLKVVRMEEPLPVNPQNSSIVVNCPSRATEKKHPGEMDASQGGQVCCGAAPPHAIAPVDNNSRAVQPHSLNGTATVLRPFQDVTQHRLRNLAPPLAPEDVLRVVVLVETARTILEVADPPATASCVRAELHTVLLSVLGACEQLSSATLSVLATCLARCVDSYTTRLKLPPLRDITCTSMETAKGRDGAPAEKPAMGEEVVGDTRQLRSFLRRLPSTVITEEGTGRGEGTVFALLLSPMEAAEAAQLAAHRGGLGTLLRPTEVLQQLAVLATVVQHRLAYTLFSTEEQRDQVVQRMNLESKEDDKTPMYGHASTASLRCDKSVQRGLLGLLSLRERKTKEEEEEAAAPTLAARAKADQEAPWKGRRTIAMIRAEARQALNVKGISEAVKSVETSVSLIDDNSPTTSVGVSAASSSPLDRGDAATVNQLTLTDLADLCTALAAMGFRGSGTHVVTPTTPSTSPISSADPLWQLAADYACTEVKAVAEAREVERSSPDGADAETVESVVAQTMTDVRHLLFALDHVDCVSEYDRVMTQLVRLQLLPAPIPAPSASVRAMKKVG